MALLPLRQPMAALDGAGHPPPKVEAVFLGLLRYRCVSMSFYEVSKMRNGLSKLPSGISHVQFGPAWTRTRSSSGSSWRRLGIRGTHLPRSTPFSLWDRGIGCDRGEERRTEAPSASSKASSRALHVQPGSASSWARGLGSRRARRDRCLFTHLPSGCPSSIWL